MDTYEDQLHDEGGHASFAAAAGGDGDRETLQIAFHERFALARKVDEKRDVVRDALLPGTPEAMYYSALCDLHELQLFIQEERKSQEGGGAARATQLLARKRDQLLNTVEHLRSKSCEKKAKRVHQRLLLLELELHSRVKETPEGGGDGGKVRLFLRG